MLKRYGLSMVLVWLLGVTTMYGAVSKQKLLDIVKNQEMLSTKITKDYRHQALEMTIKHLESGHYLLQKNIDNPKIKNLIKFLNICLEDLKKISNKPYSRENELLVSEISLSLREGSHYVLDEIK